MSATEPVRRRDRWAVALADFLTAGLDHPRLYAEGLRFRVGPDGRRRLVLLAKRPRKAAP